MNKFKVDYRCFACKGKHTSECIHLVMEPGDKDFIYLTHVDHYGNREKHPVTSVDGVHLLESEAEKEVCKTCCG